MSQVKQVTLQPGALNLFGGPQSEPFGLLVAEALDNSGRPVSGVRLDFSVDNSALQIEPQPGNPARARVGAYRPCTATVTVREALSGLSARARVTVNILDAGPPRSGSSAHLSTIFDSIAPVGGSVGALRAGILPRGDGRAPRPSSFSLEVAPGEDLPIEISLARPATHLLVGAAGLGGYYEMNLAQQPRLERLTLRAHFAPECEAPSVNLEIVARDASGLSETSTPIYVAIRREEG